MSFQNQFFTPERRRSNITVAINSIADEVGAKIWKTRGPGRGKAKEGGATKAKEGKQAMRNGKPANPDALVLIISLEIFLLRINVIWIPFSSAFLSVKSKPQNSM